MPFILTLRSYVGNYTTTTYLLLLLLIYLQLTKHTSHTIYILILYIIELWWRDRTWKLIDWESLTIDGKHKSIYFVHKLMDFIYIPNVT